MHVCGVDGKGAQVKDGRYRLGEFKSRFEETMETAEIVIVGGGFAGIAAGITLARANRRVVVIDSGQPRNRASSHLHGVVGQEGTNPSALLASAHQDFAGFGGILWPGYVDSLQSAVGQGAGWIVSVSGGEQIKARHILVATGITDLLPEVPGLEGLWGTRVFHCPYCHGYESRGKSIGVIGGKNPKFTFRMVNLLRKWTDAVTFYPNGLALVPDQRELLQRRGISLVEAPVEKVVPIRDKTAGVVVETAEVKESFDVCFTGPEFCPNDSLLRKAGCQVHDGWVVSEGGKTSLPGIWTAGNVTSSPDQISQALGSGVAVAIRIDQEILDAELASCRE